jgi:transposase-like protein
MLEDKCPHAERLSFYICEIFQTKLPTEKKKYIVRRKLYTAMFKLEVVDFSKEEGNREAARTFNVGETSLQEWRKEEAAIKCLDQKKRAMTYRRCFRPELEETLVEWVLSERLKGNTVSTTSILLKARRLAEENKIENFKAYPSWAFMLMRRNNLCIRSTSSVGQKLPDDWEAKVEKFRLYVKENLCGVDPAHFANMGKVLVSFDLPSSRTMHLKGAKEVSAATTGQEISNFMVVLSMTSDGGKLPPLVVF